MYEEWFDTEYENRFAFDLVDPNDLETVKGRMSNVIITGCNRSEGYYSDTRTASDIRLHDVSEYIENTMVRIHHYVDAKNYHSILGTYFVTGSREEYERGRWSGDLYLDSALKGIEFDFLTAHYSIAAGKYSNDIFADLFRRLNSKYRIMPGVNNTRYNEAKVYEYGTNYLTMLFELCDKCSARLNVDEYGVVVIENYTSPANRAPIFEFDYDSKQSLIIGGVTRETNQFDMPGAVSIMSKENNAEVIGLAEAPSTSIAHPSQRGYRKTEIKNYTDLSPFTVQQANVVSRQILNEALVPSMEFNFRSYYVPLKQGDIVTLKIDNQVHKCLVKTLEISFEGMIMNTYLKKVG